MMRPSSRATYFIILIIFIEFVILATGSLYLYFSPEWSLTTAINNGYVLYSVSIPDNGSMISKIAFFIGLIFGLFSVMFGGIGGRKNSAALSAGISTIVFMIIQGIVVYLLFGVSVV